MHTIAREGVEEHRQGCHEGFTFTRRHLGNLALMKYDTTKQLHVVVNHVPGHLVATSNPMVVPNGFVTIDVHEIVLDGEITVEIGCRHDDIAILCFSKTACSVLYDGIYRRQHFCQTLFEEVEHFHLFLVDGLEDGLTLINLSFLNLLFQLGNLGTLVLHLILQLCLDFIDLGTKFIVAELLNGWLHCKHLLYNWANLLDVARSLVAKQCAKKLV